MVSFSSLEKHALTIFIFSMVLASLSLVLHLSFTTDYIYNHRTATNIFFDQRVVQEYHLLFNIYQVPNVILGIIRNIHLAIQITKLQFSYMFHIHLVLFIVPGSQLQRP